MKYFFVNLHKCNILFRQAGRSRFQAGNAVFLLKYICTKKRKISPEIYRKYLKYALRESIIIIYFFTVTGHGKNDKNVEGYT